MLATVIKLFICHVFVICFSIYSHFTLFTVCMWREEFVPWYTRGSQKTTLRNWFSVLSPSTMWVSGTELRLCGAAGSIFLCPPPWAQLSSTCALPSDKLLLVLSLPLTWLHLTREASWSQAWALSPFQIYLASLSLLFGFQPIFISNPSLSSTAIEKATTAILTQHGTITEFYFSGTVSVTDQV